MVLLTVWTLAAMGDKLSFVFELCAGSSVAKKIQYNAYNMGFWLNFWVWKKRILNEPVVRFILIIFDF
ncbi:hypothetical protein PSC71_16710 [Devosia sp. J2-20]|uniref:hypothetical protein n=1 Tax=Devosia sp. J2-20 TaxID=3026161 RepID=UPI00249A340C|nr:hypothetical protein [Devosia sp. J2-20]WDQ98817.1 hypothetical protein PSC71_16710 [Devosia sp. J2-20]